MLKMLSMTKKHAVHPILIIVINIFLRKDVFILSFFPFNKLENTLTVVYKTKRMTQLIKIKFPM